MPASISRSTRLQENKIKIEDQFFCSFNLCSKSNLPDLDYISQICMRMKIRKITRDTEEQIRIIKCITIVLNDDKNGT